MPPAELPPDSVTRRLDAAVAELATLYRSPGRRFVIRQDPVRVVRLWNEIMPHLHAALVRRFGAGYARYGSETQKDVQDVLIECNLLLPVQVGTEPSFSHLTAHVCWRIGLRMKRRQKAQKAYEDGLGVDSGGRESDDSDLLVDGDSLHGSPEAPGTSEQPGDSNASEGMPTFRQFLAVRKKRTLVDLLDTISRSAGREDADNARWAAELGISMDNLYKRNQRLKDELTVYRILEACFEEWYRNEHLAHLQSRGEERLARLVMAIVSQPYATNRTWAQACEADEPEIAGLIARLERLLTGGSVRKWTDAGGGKEDDPCQE